MIGLIIIGVLMLVYFGRVKSAKSTHMALSKGYNKLFILYSIHSGTALGLGIGLPILAIYSVPFSAFLLILTLAISTELITGYFCMDLKE